MVLDRIFCSAKACLPFWCTKRLMVRTRKITAIRANVSRNTSIAVVYKIPVKNERERRGRATCGAVRSEK